MEFPKWLRETIYRSFWKGLLRWSWCCPYYITVNCPLNPNHLRVQTQGQCSPVSWSITLKNVTERAPWRPVHFFHVHMFVKDTHDINFIIQPSPRPIYGCPHAALNLWPHSLYALQAHQLHMSGKQMMLQTNACHEEKLHECVLHTFKSHH